MGNLRFSGRWNALHLHRFYHRFRSFSRAFPGPMWQTKAIMLIEIWERLRGYDKWVQTEAKVESSQVEETVHSTRYGIVYSYASGLIVRVRSNMQIFQFLKTRPSINWSAAKP
jgi:hypothetical protein